MAHAPRASGRASRKTAARGADIDVLRAQQAATAEILRAISQSSTDVRPVFDIIVASAARLCDANFAFVMLYRDDRLRLAAHTECTSEFARYLERGIPLDRHTSSGRAALDRSTTQILDFFADREALVTPAHRVEGVRTILAVPLLREDALLGVITLWRREVRPFGEDQVGLLEIFANHAVIAVENARLFDEIRDKSRELALANTYKSRFLAAASHDLRQPLHALNLFAAQMRTATDPAERSRLVVQIGSAIGAMNELFDSLLDMSKLEAGVLEPDASAFPAARVLERMATTFTAAAREKDLKLRVVPTRAWVRSDPILLERILLNLVSNAVRYTARGGVVVGCRRRAGRLVFEVWDSGPGIAENQKENIFREFYQVAAPEAGRRGGLGLGLAIVDRLSGLLDHPVAVASRLGKGSRFSVSVPRVAQCRMPSDDAEETPRIADTVSGKLIVVIDDDALVLDAMNGILTSWRCNVLPVSSGDAALAAVRQIDRRPDAIISDYRLADGRTGIEAIENLRAALGAPVPAFLMSGDTAPDRLRDATQGDYVLLHKPVAPMTLRAMLNRLLQTPRAP